MKQRLLILIVMMILSISVSAVETVYIISIQRTNTELSLISIDLSEGPGQDYLDETESEYKANMVSFNGEKLFTINFSKGEFIIEHRGTEVTEYYNASEEVIELTFPYYNNAKIIEILDEKNIKKLKIDLSSYARCNQNEFCDFNENKNSCAEDCKKEAAKEVVKEEQISIERPIIEEPKEKTFLEELEEKGIGQVPLTIIIALLIIFIGILVLSRKKKEEK